MVKKLGLMAVSGNLCLNDDKLLMNNLSSTPSRRSSALAFRILFLALLALAGTRLAAHAEIGRAHV